MEKNTSYTIGEILIKSEGYLRKKRIKNPRLEAELLLSFVHSTDRLWIYTNWFEKIRDDKLEKLRQLLLRRTKGEPLHYILGYKEFMTLRFYLQPGVLIPRFETEELVEKVVEDSRKGNFRVFADIGCGSGVIAISIAKFVGSSTVYATDISDKAIKLTAENAKVNGVENKVKIFKGNLLEPLEPFIDQIEVFVSNPPYVNHEEWKSLDEEIVKHEPKEALLAPEDGLFYYRAIIENLLKNRTRNKGKLIYFEISPARIEGVKELIKRLKIERYEVLNDMSGKARILKIVL